MRYGDANDGEIDTRATDFLQHVEHGEGQRHRAEPIGAEPIGGNHVGNEAEDDEAAIPGNDLQHACAARPRKPAAHSPRRSGNFEELTRLAENKSQVFPYLQEVVKAHVDRFPKDGTKGRPEKVIEEIINTGVEDFHQVFIAFSDVQSIYGFGDIQLKHLYDKVMQNRQ